MRNVQNLTSKKGVQLVVGVLVAITISVATSSRSQAAYMTVPTDLDPGDEYRLVFVTSTTINVAPSGVSFLPVGDVNANVSGVAASNFNLNSLGATWTAIYSDDTTHAYDNTLTDPANGAHPDVPIYNVFDLRVADTKADLWDGTLDTAILYEEDGTSAGNVDVRTHTNTDGTRDEAAFGGSGLNNFGSADDSNSAWVNINSGGGSTTQIYGISSVLTVASPVPEPSTFVLGAFGLLSLGMVRRRRRRRA